MCSRGVLQTVQCLNLWLSYNRHHINCKHNCSNSVMDCDLTFLVWIFCPYNRQLPPSHLQRGVVSPKDVSFPHYSSPSTPAFQGVSIWIWRQCEKCFMATTVWCATSVYEYVSYICHWVFNLCVNFLNKPAQDCIIISTLSLNW